MGVQTLNMLAIDFGASSGRAMSGSFDGTKISVQEIHRFVNDPVRLGGSLYWDFLRLFHELKVGIRSFKQQYFTSPSSIAVDTWGVDFGLVNSAGHLLGNPYHYRDDRTTGMMEELFKIVPKTTLFQQTGIQPLQFNTIVQLYAMLRGQGLPTQEDTNLLFMPDLFQYYLSGERVTEYTIASTSGLLDPVSQDWCTGIMEQLGIPKSLFTPIVMPGTKVGLLRNELCDELQIDSVPIVVTTSHDTASAVVSVPTTEQDYAYISCGTWSLMGIETDKPVITEQSEKWSFTNEGGAGQKIRLLKNIMGLWLLQECKRQWELESEVLTFAQMQDMALRQKGHLCYVNPDDPAFLAPDHMPNRIRNFCKISGQYIPQTKAEIVRCVLDSLAMKFKQTLEEAEVLSGRRLNQIHMVGGGIQNTLLCQLTSNATGRVVIAGPTEATAIGNLMMQAMAHGEVRDIAQIRQVVIDSFPPEVYSPMEEDVWQVAYMKFSKVCRFTERG